METTEKAVITIATGESKYIEMAVNLARSFKWWHKNNEIKFFLATDRKDLIPFDLQDINLIELTSEQANQGFCSKLYLDKIAPAKQNIFIDADCLCYGNLEFLFDRFQGNSVSVIGDTINQGEFFCDVFQICKKFNIDRLPRFVGALYFLQKDDICTQVFSKARELKFKYDELGLVRLREKENEEPLIAISMAIYNQIPLVDNGTIKADVMSFLGGIKSDVLKGIAYAWNNPNIPYPTWVHLKDSKPKIIHFNDRYNREYIYKSETVKLEKIMKHGWSMIMAKTYTFLIIDIPNIAFNLIKSNLKKIQKILYQYDRRKNAVV